MVEQRSMLNYTRIPVVGSWVGDGGGRDAGVVGVDEGDAETEGLEERGKRRTSEFENASRGERKRKGGGVPRKE